MNSLIQTPTNNLNESLYFYNRLNFKRLSNEASIRVSDGKVVIEINPDRFARAAIILYKKNWDTEVNQLQDLTAIVPQEQGFLLADPSGSWIYLMNGQGPDLDISACGPPIIGNFAGLSLESVDINKSVKIFEILGFKVTMGAIEQGWICLANKDDFTVSLMKPFACPHLFFNPSLTYFNSGNNPAIIAKVRALEIPITEEITHFSKDGSVDNIIIRDPGGLGFFVFND